MPFIKTYRIEPWCRTFYEWKCDERTRGSYGNRDCTVMSYECHSAGMNTGCLLDALQEGFSNWIRENVHSNASYALQSCGHHHRRPSADSVSTTESLGKSPKPRANNAAVVKISFSRYKNYIELIKSGGNTKEFMSVRCLAVFILFPAIIEE